MIGSVWNLGRRHSFEFHTIKSKTEAKKKVKNMKKIVTILSMIFILTNLGAQSIDEKVKTLMIIDGTLKNIEELITQTVNQQQQMNPTIPNGFWNSLNEELQEKALPNFFKLVSPIYTNAFSENQIDDLLKFYNSDIGKTLVLKQPQIIAELNMPIRQWSQDVNSQIISKIENRGNEVVTTEEIESFEQNFKLHHGLEILNLSDLVIDQEHNPGTLLIDFAVTDGLHNLTKEIIVKNNTDSLLTFKKPLFLNDENILFDWGNDPIKPKESRTLKFILNSKEAEEDKYYFFHVSVNHGNGFPIGIKYSIPITELKYSLSTDSLAFESFEREFSKVYEFEITNIGNKSFRISEIEMDKSLAYLFYDREMIEPNRKTTIKILFDSILVSEVKEVDLNLEIKLKKSRDEGFHNYPDAIIYAKIK